MKTFVKFAALFALAAAAISPATEAPDPEVCLETTRIDSTHVLDAKTILFRMRDGTVWRNTLRNSCPTLKFNGFVYTVRLDEVCGNQQSIQVLRSHEVCMLGPFTKLPKKAG